MKHCKNNVHKYRRFRVNPGDKESKRYFYRCTRCPHSTYSKEMILDRYSECWVCGKTFQMTINTLQLKPHCGCKNRVTIQTPQPLKPETQDLLNLLLEKVNNGNP